MSCKRIKRFLKLNKTPNNPEKSQKVYFVVETITYNYTYIKNQNTHVTQHWSIERNVNIGKHYKNQYMFQRFCLQWRSHLFLLLKNFIMDLRLHDAAIFLYYFKDDFLNIVISLSLSCISQLPDFASYLKQPLIIC